MAVVETGLVVFVIPSLGFHLGCLRGMAIVVYIDSLDAFHYISCRHIGEGQALVAMVTR